ncbi:MAG: hypothetical protein WD069_09755 [Planctomycetales bacterium]
MTIYVPNQGELGILRILKDRHDDPNDGGHFELQLSTDFDDPPGIGENTTVADVSGDGAYNADFKGYMEHPNDRKPTIDNPTVVDGVAKMRMSISYYFDSTASTGENSNTCVCWWLTWYEPTGDQWYLLAVEALDPPVVFDATHHAGESNAWVKTIDFTAS